MTETEAPSPPGLPPPIPALPPRPAAAEEDRLVALTAYALSVAAREMPTPEAVESRRAEAARLLTEHAFRTLHNEVTRLRQDAVDQYLAGRREPSGIWGTVGACAVALFFSSTLLIWMISHPERLAAFARALGR